MVDDNTTEATCEFWSWFAKNQSVLVNEFGDFDDHVEPSREAVERIENILGEMTETLHKYDERLYPLCGLTPFGRIELIVTAMGDAEAFESADTLIDAAPDSEDWIFTSLKPRIPGAELGLEVHTMDGKAGPDNIQFAIREADGERILVLVFDIEQDEVDEETAFIGLNLVEGLLGEQDLATGFDAIEAVTSKTYETLELNLNLKDITILPTDFDQRQLH